MIYFDPLDGKIHSAPSPTASGVTSVSNSDGSLTISPTTGAVIASLNTDHINNWTKGQVFSSTIQVKQYATNATSFIINNFGVAYYWGLKLTGNDFNIENNFGTIPLTIPSGTNIVTINNGLNLVPATASTIASFDSSKNLVSLSTSTYPSLTELSYVKGVTSALQTQLNAKVPTSRTLTINGVAYDLSADRSWTVSGGGSPAGSGTELQYRLNSTTFGAVPGTIVDAANAWTGYGITPLARVHSKATSTTLTAPSSPVITRTAEVAAVAPTVVATQVTGPDDSTTASLGVPSQVDGSGSYLADGSTSITYNVYGCITVAGVDYYVGTPSTNSFTDNSDGQPFTNALSWSAVTNATKYIVQAVGSANNGNPNFTIDVGNVTTFNDDGAQVTNILLPTLFSTICFYPQPTPTANDPTTFGGSANAGYGNYPDDGSISSVGYDIRAYDNTGVIPYFSNNPTSGTIFPPGLGGTFGPDLTWASGGSQIGFKIIITVSFTAGGTSVGSYDAGNVTSLSNFVANSADVVVTPTVSSFTPSLTRGYSAYGDLTSPTLHYSSAGNAYSFTDSAPATGYVVLHTVTYDASTPNAKILGSFTGQTLNNSYSTTALTFYETASPNLWTGDSVVTPVHYGIQGTGQTYNLKFYASATSPYTYFSSGSVIGTHTFPNDSVYYYLSVSWTVGGGTGTRILRDIGSGYADYTDFTGSNSFNYFSNSPAWTTGIPVTPNTVEATSAIFESAAAHSTDPAQVVIKSTGSSPFMRMDFKDNLDATQMSITNDSSYNMQLFSSGANFDFYAPTIGLMARLGSNNSVLNFTNATGYSFLINRGGSGTMFKVLTNGAGRTRAFLGNSLTDSFGSTLNINPDNTADEGIYINHQSANGIVFRAGSSGTGILINAFGKVALNRTIIGSGILTIGAGDSSNPQIQFDDTATVSTNVGGLTRKTSDGALYYNYIAGTSTRIITDTGTSISANVIPKMSSASQMVASGISDTGSIISFSATESVQFSNGLGVSSNKNITMNGGAYLGGVVTKLGSVSASTSLNIANHSPFCEFTGSTSGRTLTLPTAASAVGTIFHIFNRASVSVTVATTSSQNININATTATSVVLQPGDNIKFVATASSTWDAFSYVQNILSVANGGTGASTLLGAGLATVTNVSLTNQGADIATTNLATIAGLYKVNYELQDTTADLTAGVVTLTISYTDGAGATTTTTTQALTGVGRSQGSVYVQLASGNLTYATTHTGIFGTAKYALYLSTERLN